MDITANRAVKIVAASLFATVLLQIAYMAFLGGPTPLKAGEPLTSVDVIRYFDNRGGEIAALWTMEAIAFLAIAMGSIVALVRTGANAVVWTALGLSGVFNTVQIGIGLAMFEPAARAGGDDTGLFFTFVMGAFFFYFVAKALIGLAGVVFGMKLIGSASGGAKALGVVTALTGLGAVAINVAAMALGGPVLFAAGAAGTVATLFLAIAIASRTRSIEG
ncbi:hypothetical protein GCM10023115_09730 [Pontixanthobacter gangjinensis]|uniref:Uncharacterized protein n=1 Tax=Pontixanthobacter gangjinensis TaxID=1028742 RepID=A0A6I4SKC3_9SPHN|nr:hypothetical protein [Pontixanthobacter gangjinensis]MXO56219.1 hypothetical protein [Pontixanthobacter gangjinensis]